MMAHTRDQTIPVERQYFLGAFGPRCGGSPGSQGTESLSDFDVLVGK